MQPEDFILQKKTYRLSDITQTYFKRNSVFAPHPGTTKSPFFAASDLQNKNVRYT